MAKGQLRSGREKKKPKQDKPKKTAAPSASSQINTLFHKPASGKPGAPGKK
jgi:hypothetical protein